MHERITIPRAIYEAQWGLETDQLTIGACIYSSPTTIFKEFLFADVNEEIAMLEQLWRLE